MLPTVTIQIPGNACNFPWPQLEYVNNVQEGLPESREFPLFFTSKEGKTIVIYKNIWRIWTKLKACTQSELAFHGYMVVEVDFLKTWANDGSNDTICRFCSQDHVKTNATGEKAGTKVMWFYFVTCLRYMRCHLKNRITFNFPTAHAPLTFWPVHTLVNLRECPFCCKKAPFPFSWWSATLPTTETSLRTCFFPEAFWDLS